MDIRNLTADAEVFTANAYLVAGERDVLVDVGAMPGIEAEIDRLDAIVLTHQHGDHVAEIDAVIDAFDPDVYALESHPARTHELVNGEEVTIGDDRYEVVYTPGHAGDHVAFLSETTLFSGDVVVYNDGAFSDGSFGRTDLPGQSRERLVESLQELLDRMGGHVEHMYPGHGDAFHGDVREVVERALERASRREPKYPE